MIVHAAERKDTACSLTELVVALGLSCLVFAMAARFVAAMGTLPNKGGGLKAVRLSVTLERLVNELSDARLVLAPRSMRGARRGKYLLVVDGSTCLASFFCRSGKLQCRRVDPRTGTLSTQELGDCSGALFHYRGKKRRILRIRLGLDECFLATSVRFFNSLPGRRPQSMILRSRGTRANRLCSSVVRRRLCPALTTSLSFREKGDE